MLIFFIDISIYDIDDAVETGSLPAPPGGARPLTRVETPSLSLYKQKKK
jgi:hypothetical protein